MSPPRNKFLPHRIRLDYPQSDLQTPIRNPRSPASDSLFEQEVLDHDLDLCA